MRFSNRDAHPVMLLHPEQAGGLPGLVSNLTQHRFHDRQEVEILHRRGRPIRHARTDTDLVAQPVQEALIRHIGDQSLHRGCWRPVACCSSPSVIDGRESENASRISVILPKTSSGFLLLEASSMSAGTLRFTRPMTQLGCLTRGQHGDSCVERKMEMDQVRRRATPHAESSYLTRYLGNTVRNLGGRLVLNAGEVTRVEVVRQFDQIVVRVADIDATDRAVSTGPVDRTFFNCTPHAVRCAETSLSGSAATKHRSALPEVAWAAFGSEFVADCVQIDLARAED